MAPSNTRQVGPLLVAADGRTPLTAVMWRCSKCREAKPETDFPVTDGASGRRRAACKSCEAIRQAILRTRERRASGPSPASHRHGSVSVSVRVQGSARLHFAPDGFDRCSISQLVGGA